MPNSHRHEEVWYLPVFGVYHPRKKDQIIGVFDSSAIFNGTSLNDVLLSGPDLNNSLLSVLRKFRMESIAVTADIQQMFHCLYVRPDHRNFLRFFWHRNNQFNQEIVEYRMKVHVFGNRPSPVTVYGLHQTAISAEETFGTDVKDFVLNHFYVDDGLISLPSPAEATNLMKRTQQALQVHGNLRLHKFASSCKDVMAALPANDLNKDLKDLELSSDELPLQRSLGLYWDLNTDVFTFRISQEAKPLTRRGVLSVINSIYDPLGFAAPVVITGKLILRKLTLGTTEWDEPLPEVHRNSWDRWRQSLSDLENIQIPRVYVPQGFNGSLRNELHVYCDASENAIAAAAYIRSFQSENDPQVGFVIGKAKVAPTHCNTIPRLELCAATLAVELSETVVSDINITFDCIKFYSRVVLWYIKNETRRFFIYVSNRVERIRRSTEPTQWYYVPTDKNPADLGTRALNSKDLQNSIWLNGPTYLRKNYEIQDQESDNVEFPLLAEESDKEIRKTLITTCANNVQTTKSTFCEGLDRFSTWKRLINVIRRMKQNIRLKKLSTRAVTFSESEQCAISLVQKDVYADEIKCIKENRHLSKNSQIAALGPVVDANGMFRVGGRLRNLNLDDYEKNPLIIPNSHHVALLIVRHYHHQTKHQGRHFTEGAVRSAGLWVIGLKRIVTSIIHKCVPCRKLRGKFEIHKMADLPNDKIQPCPPFTNVGVDVFGPWHVVTRRTRGGSAESKRWAVLFTCIVTRAVHVEIIESLSACAFINALRRFESIRGKVKIYRSDRGTNFVGATDDLKIDAVNVEDDAIKQHIYNTGTEWIFNLPHASHFGGVWERMIGTIRRVLNSMLSEHKTDLTQDVLCTFMAEVSAIVNARPLVAVSSDPDAPFILSPINC